MKKTLRKRSEQPLTVAELRHGWEIFHGLSKLRDGLPIFLDGESPLTGIYNII